MRPVLQIDDMLRFRAAKVRRRQGLSLPELVISLLLLGMLAAGTASLSQVGRLATEQSRQWDAQAQTGRVAVQRIRQSVKGAFGSNAFPAVVVFPTLHSGGYVPDTLVVWKPIGSSTPQSPQGLPMTDELLFYFPDPTDPQRLIESRVTDFPMPAPALTDTSGWTSLLTSAKTDDSSTDWIELSRDLRIANVAPSTNRAVVHFHISYAPADAEFANYTANATAWEDLPWPLGLVSAELGSRRAICNIELQMKLPGAAQHFFVTSAAAATFSVEP